MRLFKSREAQRTEVPPSMGPEQMPGWHSVGAPRFKETGSTRLGLARTHELSFTVGSAGSPYLAFFDEGLEVLNFDGKTWKQIGKSDVLNLVSPQIAVSADGTPFVVAPTQTGGMMQATVVRFDGKSWDPIAQTGNGQVLDLNLRADDTGSVFMAYRDAGHGDLPVVSRFDGKEWHNVGRPGFSAGSGAHDLSFALDPRGVPWVAFSAYDPHHSGRGSKGAQAVVMKYGPDDWDVVGTPYFSEGYVNQTSIAIDSRETAYVAFCDGAHAEAATVMRFDGSVWSIVGDAGFSTGRVYFITIAIGSDGTPYVAFSDHAQGKRVTVMGFYGGAWKPVCEGLPDGEAQEVHLAIDRSDRLYVAYLDVGAGSAPTVMSYQPNGPQEASR